MLINTYLTFNGNCEEAFLFYERCFQSIDSASLSISRFDKVHGSDADFPSDWLQKVMHARLDVGHQVLMGSDAPPGHQSQFGGFAVSINVKEVEQAERIFAELSEGGSVVMPLAEAPWAVRFGMLEDRFGVSWMVNCEG